MAGCRVRCLLHGVRVRQHISQSTTATSRHQRDMTSDVKSDEEQQTNKPTAFLLPYLKNWMVSEICELLLI